MEKVLKGLRRQRATVKSNATRIRSAADGLEPLSIAEAEIRMKKLEDQWTEFERIQKQIEEVKIGDTDEEQQLFDKEEEDERNVFETGYFHTARKLQTIIDRPKREAERVALEAAQATAARAAGPAAGQREGNPAGDNVNGWRRSGVKLPPLSAPEFDGDYSKWMTFRDCFEATIHNDPHIQNLHKFWYLRGALKGEASELLIGIETTTDNYEEAWKLVKKTYDNRKLIVNSHLNELLAFPVIGKEKIDKHSSMKKFVLHIRKHLKSLQALKQPVQHWDTIIIHLAKNRLDFVTQCEWEKLVEESEVDEDGDDKMPTVEEFLTFVKRKSSTLELVEANKPKHEIIKTASSKVPCEKKERRVTTAATAKPECPMCKNKHGIYQCPEFLALTPQDRSKEARDKRLCINCLTPGHFAKTCKGSHCKKCENFHNTLLHWEFQKSTGVSSSKEEDSSAPTTACHVAKSEVSNKADPGHLQVLGSAYSVRNVSSQVLLSTALVYVIDSSGNQHRCRALLDPGSQLHFITDNLVKKLRLETKRANQCIDGINNAVTNAGKATTIKIKSIHTDYTALMNCLVLPKITQKLPQVKINRSELRIPGDIMLADPTFDEPGEIDILISAALFWSLLCKGQIRHRVGQPSLQQTKLGWIVGGELVEVPKDASASCHLVTNEMLNNQLENFWRVESLQEPRKWTKEETNCDRFFEETFQRDKTGRFIVKLPKKEEITLGESREHAEMRLTSLERRFIKNPQLKEDYATFLKDYEEKGHMQLIQDKEKEDEEVYFIPHQPVIKPDSITTKLRVVFDASATTSLGTSLNQKLQPGPNLQTDLLEIILRFRAYQVVITADIAQMFRQILVDKEDCKLQCILWREDPEDAIKIFQLMTVTYGTTCAPYLAIRCLRQLAKEAKEDLPDAAQALERDCYMDDILTGARSVDEARRLRSELSELLQRGQFQLRKWRASDPLILADLNEQCKSQQLLVLDGQGPLKTLGLLWDSNKDCLQYQVEPFEKHKITKRNVLSKIAKVYDPLGLCGPVLIAGKNIMQEIWIRRIDWDQQIPPDLCAAWCAYYEALPKLNELIIPRNINPGNISESFNIVGFSDASEKALGACLYAVSKNGDGRVSSRLICSKSKVAPVKTVSLPRLELMAALLLAELVALASKTYEEKICKITLFSDSTITLGWIRSEPNVLKTFVANRVTKIQDLTASATWKHTPSLSNPADMLSRGIHVQDFVENKLWWNGPSWVVVKDQWPLQPITIVPDLSETKVSLTVTREEDIFLLSSNYSKLINIIAYCLRIKRFSQLLKSNTEEVKMSRNERVIPPLSVMELKSAEEILARKAQQQAFSKEIIMIQQKQELRKRCPLIGLNPFIDVKGLLRVGGRLQQADLSYDRKHPIILPSYHAFTTLLLRHEHEKLLHCGAEQLLSVVRQRFWILSGRRAIRKIIQRCHKCFRCRPSVPQVIMGNLPEERVNASVRPFICVGVDYAGPIKLKESHRRGRVHTFKAYLAIFVCFNTKAVHIELVTSLSTEAFLAALRRFTARRGVCNQIFSDNGTNFIGAASELAELQEFFEKQNSTITKYLAQRRITWSFIPPRAPHCGGLWEAAVKVAKQRLNAVTQGLTLTFEESYTLLTEIEAIMNSRPLTPLSSDPTSLQVLTPGHFLINDSLIQPVQPELLDIPDNRLSRWQLLQKVRQHFWKRWSLEYLQELQKRSKWCSGSDSVSLGTMVLLMEDNTSPLQWNLGRVMEVYPSNDGLVRKVTVKTQTGLFVRSVRKLCPLPVDSQFQNS